MTHREPETTLLDDTQTLHQHIEATQPDDLITLLEQLCNSTTAHTRPEDRDILYFCLHHLFLGIDALSNVACQTFSEPVFVAEAQSASVWNLKQQCAAWTYLREIKQALERIEPLCQLLNDTCSAILASLDTPAATPLSESTELPELFPTKPDTSFVIHLYCEQYQDALAPTLAAWQRSLTQQYTFRYRFAHLLTITPTLIQMDNALSSLFTSVSSLFRDTVPALSIAEQDEVAAHILDLMQKVDHITLQSDTMMSPLHTLIKQFALGSEMH